MEKELMVIKSRNEGTTMQAVNAMHMSEVAVWRNDKMEEFIGMDVASAPNASPSSDFSMSSMRDVLEAMKNIEKQVAPSFGRWQDTQWASMYIKKPFYFDEVRVSGPPTTKLTRVPVAVQDLDSQRARLAVEAEVSLGYRPLLQEMKLPCMLARALAALEIEPYDRAAVAKYKEEMRAWKQSEINKELGEDQEEVANRMQLGPRRVRLCTWKSVFLGSYTKPVPEFVLQKCLQIKNAFPDAQFAVDELTESTRTLDPFMVVYEKGASPEDPERSFYVEVWEEPAFEAQVIDK